MGTDRVGYLAIKAKERGLIDYDNFDPTDIYQLLQERSIFNHLENEFDAETLKADINRTAGAISSSLTQESYENLVSRLDDIYNKLLKTYFPYVTWTESITQEQEASSLKERWEAQFGSIDNPDVQQKLEEVQSQLDKSKSSASEESGKLLKKYL